MLKFYRSQGEQLLLALSYLQYRDVNLLDLVEAIRYVTPKSAAEKALLDSARKSVRDMSSTQVTYWHGPLLKHVNRALLDEQHGRGESDLVDQIVRALQLPWGRNVLSGQSMQRLRAAVLLPSEQAGLLARLRAKEMSCTTCGAPFHDHESVTMRVYSDGTQGIECHRCVPPVHIPCVSCGETVELSDKAMKAMSRMQCKSCQEAKRDKTPPPAETFTDYGPNPTDWARSLAPRTPRQPFVSLRGEALTTAAPTFVIGDDRNGG